MTNWLRSRRNRYAYARKFFRRTGVRGVTPSPLEWKRNDLRRTLTARFRCRILPKHLFNSGIDLLQQFLWLVTELVGRHTAPRQLLLAGIDHVHHKLAFADGDRSCSSRHGAPHHETRVERGNAAHAAIQRIGVTDAHVRINGTIHLNENVGIALDSAQSSFGQLLVDSAGDDQGQRGTGYRVMVAPGEGFEFGKIEVLVVFDFDFLGLHAEAQNADQQEQLSEPRPSVTSGR